MGIDTKANTLWGGSAPQIGDMRLLEAGGERGGALVSDLVVLQTVSEEQSEDGERSGVSMGIDTKANTRVAAHFSSLSTPFALMQLAMMMAEATPSLSSERSIFSVGFVPLSSSI
jgi:hypothetical protein